ncbi:Cof-type HAD-IIB family hydrolase [Fonticella tunisiensis]|uniref:Cof subfamily protein (Haloacid dehalogenase superfamily)/HAD superfamily hydrolase (TIGR01484 family) n=1 Tax=Fonticella tunisiensis TaxID=1096341 RepID=A0A4R7KAC9_9CLOT|nr:Cof-type HAD-IIB family hydrolase [Fonticella tunisiensis]TDT51306.1 hypothetical protein EDD71_11936 [Fonticella tunisiensis]
MNFQNDTSKYKKRFGLNIEEAKNIKLIALDLDGTLLDDDLKISKRTIDCIKSLVHRGINIALVTGRTLGSAYLVRDILGVEVPIVAYNGGRIVVPPKGEIYTAKIPLTEAIKIIKYAENKELYVKAYIDDLMYVEKDEEASRIFCQKRGIEYKVVGKLSENLTEDVNMIIIYYKDPIYGKIDDELKNINVNITASATIALDFVPKEVSKSNGLKLVANYLNIRREEILAIGNSQNDIDMLSFAGIGIAMKNADSMLQERWNHFTEYTNNEEGVYHILKQI